MKLLQGKLMSAASDRLTGSLLISDLHLALLDPFCGCIDSWPEMSGKGLRLSPPPNHLTFFNGEAHPVLGSGSRPGFLSYSWTVPRLKGVCL